MQSLGLTVLLQAVGTVVTACALAVAYFQYRKTQLWVRLRFAAEEVEKIYTDDRLRLALQFLDWHDRGVFLPESLAHYGDEKGLFTHSVQRMKDAMSVENREHDPDTGVYDLKKPFRKPEYMIYVEVFDALFDYLSQLHVFIDAKLISGRQLKPIEYFVRRMDALKIFNGYIASYELIDLNELITSFRAATAPSWIRNRDAV